MRDSNHEGIASSVEKEISTSGSSSSSPLPPTLAKSLESWFWATWGMFQELSRFYARWSGHILYTMASACLPLCGSVLLVCEADLALSHRIKVMAELTASMGPVTCTTNTDIERITRLWFARHRYNNINNKPLPLKHTATTPDPNQTQTNPHSPHLPLPQVHPQQCLPPLHLLPRRPDSPFHSSFQSWPPTRPAAWRLY